MSNLKAKNRLIKLINILKIKWNPHPSIGLKIQIKSKEKKNLFEVWYTSYNKIKVLNHLNYTSFSKTNTFTLKITFLLLKYKKTIFFFSALPFIDDFLSHLLNSRIAILNKWSLGYIYIMKTTRTKNSYNKYLLTKMKVFFGENEDSICSFFFGF